MLEVAIVGGGLCGLALAHSLQARGGDWRLFEARERFGGRVLTQHAADGTPVDLGATWYWPATQPAMTRLVADLGLASLEQADDGRVLHLGDPNRVPRVVAMGAAFVPVDDVAAPATPGAVHGGAWRVVGGMGAVVDALRRPLPETRLRPGHALHALVDHGDFVELHLRFGEAAYAVHARRVVLALPPRVLESQVEFVPALAPDLVDAMRATPTWMATAAKAAFAYRQAFWRTDGVPGNAWIDHAQAMLCEVFDACGPDGEGAALAGFCALDIARRAQFARGRELLLDSQMTMLFGAQAADAAMLHARFWQDWATEPRTCSPIDAAGEAQAGRHPDYGDPLLTRALWGGRLYLAGSETARQGGGYLEGALSAAGRVRAQLRAPEAGAPRARRAANDEADRAPA